MVAVPSWLPLTQIAVVGALVGSLLALRWIGGNRGWGRLRRERLLLGLPWGTFASLLGVLAVYLFVQGGYWHWHDPLTLPFRAWSYFYPLGMALSAFSHAGPGHLVGNLTGALVLGSLAEYAWGHYPTTRGASAFSSPTRNPYVRAFVLFPAGVLVVGFLTALFSWGPTIGFSGVVFAFAGFALVRYPLAAVLGLVVENLASLLVDVLRDPVVVAEARPQYWTPWWAGVAVQGHLLGLFLGIVAAVLVVDRSRRPRPGRLFLGTLLMGSSFSLWIVWWYRGGEQYVLYQGLGTALLFVLALAVTLGVREWWADRERLDLRRVAALLLLLFPVLVVGSAAVIPNLATVADPTPPGDGPVVEAGDYSVVYAENVTNQMVSVVNVSVLGESTRVRTSGVVVVSEDRHIWSQSLSTGRLAFDRDGHVVVGGLGWRETVDATRRGWSVPGNGTTYIVWLRPPGEDFQVAYTAPPVVAEPVVAGRQVAVAPGNGSFELAVRRNGSELGRVPMPAANESVAVGGLTLARENASVFAEANDTRVRVASEETYPGRR